MRRRRFQPGPPAPPPGLQPRRPEDLARDAELLAESGMRRSVRLQRCARLLDCSPELLRAAVRRGEIEGHRIGRQGLRIYVDSLQAWQARRAIGAAQPQRPPPARVNVAEHRAAVARLRAMGMRI